MPAMQQQRFSQIILDEPLRKFLYENAITPENYADHKAQLRALFPDDGSCERFIRSYLTPVGMLSYRQFLKETQRMDLFLHPRYIQQAPHIHDFIEIKYLLSGSGTVHAGKELLFLQEGDFCLIPPYAPHSSEIYADETTMINLVVPMEHLHVLFPRLMSFENPLQRFLGSEQMLHPGCGLLHIHSGDDAAIRDLMRQLLDYFSAAHRSPSGEAWAESALEQCFLRLVVLQEARPGSRLRLEDKDRRIHAMVDYIRANLQLVTLGDLAAAFHFSIPYASRYIKAKTGYTFQMILLISRMEAAADLLRETDWPVDQIASEIGLSGKTNFYKQFKSFYGMNPAAFRNETLSAND